MPNEIKPLPKRERLAFKYVDKKERKMVSIRLPEALVSKIKKLSEESGYSFTDLVQHALDQYAQIQDRSK